jgi:hypothetical protein
MILSKRTMCRMVAAKLAALLALAGPSRGDNFTWENGALSTNWDNAVNWAGPANAFPDSNVDSALVNSTNVVPTLTANRTIGALTIRNGADVATGAGADNFSLTVQESLSQGGLTLIESAGSSLTVRQSPLAIDFDTDDLTINSGGSLILNGGARVQTDRLATLNAGGQIAGNGILEINGQDYFYNNGALRASGGGILTVNSAGLLALDLDGSSGNGMLIAENGSTLQITTATVGPFNGSISIYQNAAINIFTPLQQASAGSQINFHGGNGTATLQASWLVFGDEVHFRSGTAVLDATTFVSDTATFHIHEGAAVQFNAESSINDPSRIVNEFDTTLIVNNILQVGSGTGDFDWDGEAQNQVLSGHTIVNAGGDLRIDVAHIDGPGLPETYSGRLTMNSGLVDVQNDAGMWSIDGPLEMNNIAAQPPVLSGADVVIEGEVAVAGNGASRVEADATFAASSSVNVHANANLKIGTSVAGSNTVLNGGSWTGNGIVDLNARFTTVSSATTVNMPNGTFDVDGDTTGGHVILNAPLTLHVGSMDNNSNNDINDALTINSFGRLTMNLTDQNHSYDIAESLELNGAGGGFSSLHLVGSHVRLMGTTSVSGNSAASARVDIGGDMTIAGGGSFQIRGGSEAAPSRIYADATVTGNGELIVSSIGSGYLRLDDGAMVEVDLINRGHLEVGATAGNATVAAYSQTSSGTFHVGIDGLAPDTQYDQLTVTGNAILDGTLEVDVNLHGGVYTDPMTPGTFHEFELIMADSITDTFEEFVYGGNLLARNFTGLGQDRFHVGSGLFRVLDYDATELDLLNYRALAGDANGDGYVDGSDFNIWNSNKFQAGTDWTTGDFNGDGVTDGSDFSIWNSNKFTQIALGRTAGGLTLQAVPEPTGSILCCVGLLLMAAGRRRIA